MKIGAKLGLGTGTLLGVGLVIGTVAYLQNSSVHDKLDALTTVTEPVHTAANELKRKFFEATSSTLGYFMTGDTTLRERLREGWREFGTDRESYHTLLKSATDPTTASDFIAKFSEFYALAENQIALRDSQSNRMKELLQNLDGIDGLLRDRIAASVRADDPIAYRRLQVALEMQIQMNAVAKELGNYLLTGEERFRDRIAEARKGFSHFLEVYQVVLLSTEEKGWATDLMRRSNRGLALAAEIANVQVQRLAQMTEFMNQYGELGSLLDDPLLRSTSVNLTAAKQDLLDAGARANSTILLFLLAGMAFGIGAAVVTARQITSPLRRLASVMNDVEVNGQIGEVVLETSDEFRQVGTSFNTMMRRLAASNENLRSEIAERRKAEEQLAEAERERLNGLRLFARSIQRAQEEERSRIARELHDDICQRLTGLKYHVEVLEEGIRPTNRRVAKTLGAVREELDRSVNEVRRISSNLRPMVLDDFGLVTALRLLCNEFQKSHGIGAMFQVDPAVTGRLNAEAETAIYRITQQALANIARHSGAASARLALDIQNGNLRLTIVDNGRGFQTSGGAGGGPRRGFGLVSMRERAEILGGSLSVVSAPGRGTTVSVTIPTKSEDQNASN